MAEGDRKEAQKEKLNQEIESIEADCQECVGESSQGWCLGFWHRQLRLEIEIQRSQLYWEQMK